MACPVSFGTNTFILIHRAYFEDSQETWRGYAAPSGELSLWFTMGQYTISQHFGSE